MKHTVTKIINTTAFAFLFLFIIVNLISSQTISPIYFQLIREDRSAAAGFLQKINKLPSFNALLEINKKIYGEDFENEVFLKENKRRQKIIEYENLLKKNNKSRDVLFNLSLLYQEDGNQLKAEEYLKKAKEIDPMINIKN